MTRPFCIKVQSRRTRLAITKLLRCLGLPVVHRARIRSVDILLNAIIISGDDSFPFYNIVITPARQQVYCDNVAVQECSGSDDIDATIYRAVYIYDSNSRFSMFETAEILKLLPKCMWSRVVGTLYGILYSFNEFDFGLYSIDADVRAVCSGILKHGPDYLSSSDDTQIDAILDSLGAIRRFSRHIYPNYLAEMFTVIPFGEYVEFRPDYPVKLHS